GAHRAAVGARDRGEGGPRSRRPRGDERRLRRARTARRRGGGDAGRVAPRRATPMTTVLRVQDVAWRVDGAAIVENVTFDVARGELVALMGRNGAGKSTLLDLVAGLRRPAAGRIELDGRPL